MKFNIQSKLFALSGLGLLFVCAVGATGYVAATRLTGAAGKIVDTGSALMTQMTADQDHDALRADVLAALALIDDLDRQITGIERELRRLGADHQYVPFLLTLPGISWVLAYTIAAEIGDITRFATPTKLCGYTGLCPRVYQSGDKDRRGALAKNGPRYLRWALIEAATHACRHPVYRERYQRNKAGWASSAAPRSPRSTSPAAWPRRSGTCSPATSPSPQLPEAPLFVWPPDGPFGLEPTQPASHDTESCPRAGHREMSAAPPTTEREDPDPELPNRT